VAVPVFDPDVAVMVTLAGALGAVKRPVPSIVPPLAVQVTDVPAPFRNAENCAVWLTGTLEDPGMITKSLTVGVLPPPPPPQADKVNIPKNAMARSVKK
jgi:hypothetical protein